MERQKWFEIIEHYTVSQTYLFEHFTESHIMLHFRNKTEGKGNDYV